MTTGGLDGLATEDGPATVGLNGSATGLDGLATGLDGLVTVGLDGQTTRGSDQTRYETGITLFFHLSEGGGGGGGRETGLYINHT